MQASSLKSEAFSKLSDLFEAWVHETTTLNNARVARIIRLVLLDSKGSWLRPQLVFGLGDAQGHGLDELLPIAAAAEMMHCASLLHDDVIDEGFSRRGNPTANALHGNVAAVLCGDVLMARAMTLLADQAPKAIPHAAKTIAELSNSALMEQDLRYRSDVAMCDWRTVAEQKTGSLLGFCLSSLLPRQQTQKAFELGYRGNFFSCAMTLKIFTIQAQGSRLSGSQQRKSQLGHTHPGRTIARFPPRASTFLDLYQIFTGRHVLHPTMGFSFGGDARPATGERPQR